MLLMGQPSTSSPLCQRPVQGHYRESKRFWVTVTSPLSASSKYRISPLVSIATMASLAHGALKIRALWIVVIGIHHDACVRDIVLFVTGWAFTPAQHPGRRHRHGRTTDAASRRAFQVRGVEHTRPSGRAAPALRLERACRRGEAGQACGAGAEPT